MINILKILLPGARQLIFIDSDEIISASAVALISIVANLKCFNVSNDTKNSLTSKQRHGHWHHQAAFYTRPIIVKVDH